MAKANTLARRSIALKTTPAFGKLHLGDVKRPNVEALRKRISPTDDARVELRQGDCHSRAEAIIKEFPQRGTLALAFVDPEGFEVRFDLFRTFKQRPIDILFLFPSGIGVRRNLERFARSNRHTLMDGLWGGREWRALPVVKRLIGDHNAAEAGTLDQSWATEFCKRVATLGYVYYDASPPLCNETNVPMYHLLFFSKHEAGLAIWRGISKIQPNGQRRLW